MCWGWNNTTQVCGDYFINHEIRIPIKQPAMESKIFFLCGSFVIVCEVFLGCLIKNQDAVRGIPSSSHSIYIWNWGSTYLLLYIDNWELGSKYQWNWKIRICHVYCIHGNKFKCSLRALVPDAWLGSHPSSCGKCRLLRIPLWIVAGQFNPPPNVPAPEIRVW